MVFSVRKIFSQCSECGNLEMKEFSIDEAVSGEGQCGHCLKDTLVIDKHTIGEAIEFVLGDIEERILEKLGELEEKVEWSLKDE